MIKKELFHPTYESYNNDANKICAEFAKLVKPFIEDLLNKGYKYRDINYILNSEIDVFIMEEMMIRDSRAIKQQRNQ